MKTGKSEHSRWTFTGHVNSIPRQKGTIMKRLIVIGLLVLGHPVIAYEIQNVEDLKERKLIDPSLLVSLDVTKKNELNMLLENNSAYVGHLIEKTSPNTMTLLKDPRVLRKP